MNNLIAKLALVLLACSAAAVAQDDNPCRLLTAAEIEGVIGVKVSGLNSSNQIKSTDQKSVTNVCSGITPNKLSVMLMLATSDQKVADPLGMLEKTARDSANSIGAKMDAKRFGSQILCTTLIPPKQGPYVTTCMAVKAPRTAVSIAIMTTSQAQMIPIDKLHPLVEKMLGRI